jgi:hypothetical protein
MRVYSFHLNMCAKLDNENMLLLRENVVVLLSDNVARGVSALYHRASLDGAHQLVGQVRGCRCEASAPQF